MFYWEKGKKLHCWARIINLTYDALLKQVNLFGSLLGDATRQRVAIFSDNSSGWIFALYAIIKNKGITVPVDALSTPHDVAWILKDCMPASVFVARDKLAVLQEAMKESGHFPAVHHYRGYQTGYGKPSGRRDRDHG